MRTALRIFALLSVVAALGVKLAAVEPSARENRWIEAHRNDLPTTLEAIAAYPASLRPKILRELDAETRSQLYRRQIAIYLEQNQLSPEQAGALRSLASRLDARYFPGDLIVVPTCPATEIGKVFSQGPKLDWLSPRALGSLSKPTWTVSSVYFSVSQRLARSLSVSADAPNCECYDTTQTNCDCWFTGYGCRTGQCDINLDNCNYGCSGDKCGFGLCNMFLLH